MQNVEPLAQNERCINLINAHECGKKRRFHEQGSHNQNAQTTTVLSAILQ